VLLSIILLAYRQFLLCLGLVHVSAIQQGGRVNSATDLLSRGQPVKVKVMSVAGTRISLSIRDVDQATGRDLTPHLRIKSEAEMEQEQAQLAQRASSGSNAMPLGGKGLETPATTIRSAKRLTSPERWEIKQLIASGVIDASEYPDLDEEFNLAAAKAEVEEELDVEIREDEPAFLAGQTKRTLDLSPVRIVKAPDGSLNRAALSGTSLAKERRELRQQETNEEADSQATDFAAPWLDPMSSNQDRVFAQDMRGNIAGQRAQAVPEWRAQVINKATTFGKITDLSITDQRKSLPIYRLRDKLVQAIREVST
jgi:ATP-dependent RNA helicase DHX8/PRP22